MADAQQGFIFGGNTGLTYEGLKRRQAIAQAMASRNRGYPKNIGEGIASIGADIGDVLMDRSLKQQESALQAREDAMIGGAQRAMTPPPALTVAPAVQPQVSSFDETGFGGAPPPTQVANAPRVSATVPEDRLAIINKHEPDPTMRQYYAQLVSKEQPSRGAMSPTGARGMVQFGERTGRDYGLVGNGFDNRDNDDASMQAVRKFTQDNIAHFRAQVGREPTIPELAVMHQQGRQGGTNLVLGRPVDPKALRVNNIDPNATPQQALEHIKNYYGLPDTPLPDAYSARAKISAATLGGSPVNPTMSGPAPVPTAPGVGGQADSGSPDDGEHGAYDPTTPTDIKPAPGTVAQGARRPVAAPTFNPPVELTLPAEQTMPDPGPRPKEPGVEPALPGQKEWMAIINSRFASPYAKEVAQRNYEQLEKVRAYNQTIKQQEYVNAREKWEQKVDAKEKFDREREDRRAKQKADFLAANNSQADLEKKFYEATSLREQEEIKRAIDIKNADLERQKRELELKEPKEHVLEGGTVIQRGLGQREYSVAPGVPASEKLTETQARGVKSLQRATVAQSLVGSGDVLRGLKDTVAGKVPIGGNFLTSPEYQAAASAARVWAYAVLRDESGAVLGKEEIERKLWDYFPRPGDSDKEVANKEARRQYEEQSLYHSLGDKRATVDKWREGRRAQKTTEPEGTIQRSPSTGKIRRVIGGHWVYPDEF